MRSFSQSLVIGAFSVLALVACSGSDGTDGADGANALVQSTAEPAGANCLYGGNKVEVGLDTNGNNALDASEVTSSTFVCNGAGTSSLVKTSVEAAGANCPFGGTKIESGLDTNNDGTLGASEVNATDTSYVCNFGPNGTISPSSVSRLPARTSRVPFLPAWKTVTWAAPSAKSRQSSVRIKHFRQGCWNLAVSFSSNRNHFIICWWCY